MTVTADNKRRVVLPGAKPGDVFEVKDSGVQKVLTLLEPAHPRFSKGKLVRDRRTGLLVWSGNLGEEPSDAVIRNRSRDQ
jgi:hypothetical protein